MNTVTDGKPPEFTPQEPPVVSLRQRVNDRYHWQRERDRTIARLETEIAHQATKIRECQQLKRMAEGSLRSHEAWLKREAADYVADEAGVLKIDGINLKRETPKEYKDRLKARREQAEAAVRLHIQSQRPAENAS